MEQKRLVICLRTGRLGNRLALFANLIGFAAEHGYRVANLAFQSYAHLFETTRGDIYCRFPAGQRQSLFDRVPGLAPAVRKTRILYQLAHYAAKLNARLPCFGRSVITLEETSEPILSLETPAVLERIREARTVLIHGWTFRAPRSVARQADRIRQYFRPAAELEAGVRQGVARLRDKGDVAVGIHLRQGDYRTFRQGKYFYSPDRYAAWMRQIAGQIPGRKVVFFVCSDEPRHAGEFPGLAVELGVGPPVVDLYTLAECDYILGPPSTFTQWASFQGNKPLAHVSDPDAAVRLEVFRVADLEAIP